MASESLAELLENLESTEKSYAAQKSEGQAKIATARENLMLTEKAVRLQETASRARRDLAVVAAHNGGASVYAIARAMGRKDRTALYAIIGKYATPGTPTPTPDPTNTPGEVKITAAMTSMGPGYELSWPDLPDLTLPVVKIGDQVRALGPSTPARQRYEADPAHYDNLIATA